MASGISSLLGAAGIGGAIGKAIVSLELDTAKYTAEMKGAQAQTVASTNAMAQSTSKFAAVGKAAFLSIGVAAVAGLAYSVKAAIEADDALLKLQNTYENNAKLSDVTVKSFQEQAEAIQALTGASDESILTAQALLGQFKITGTQVQTLTPLIVDLATKMNIDFTAAAKSVGKAVEGNTSGLQRYGIMIDEVKGKGGEFDAVMKGLEGTVGGFAEQRGAAEPWRLLAAQFDELAEDIGHILLPLLKDLTDILVKIAPLLRVVAENLEAVAAVLLTYAAFKYLPELLFSLSLALEAVGAASIASGVLSVAAGIASVGASLAIAAPAALTFAAAFTALTAALAAWDPLQLVGDTDKLRESMEVNTKAFGESEVILGRVAVSQNLLQHATEGSTAATGAATTAIAAEQQNKDSARVAADSYVDSLKDQIPASYEAAAAADEQAAGLRRVLEATLALFDPTFALIHAVEDNAAAEKELTDARRDLNRLAEDGKKGTDAYREALDRYEESVTGAAESQADLIGAALGLREAVRVGKTDIDSAVDSIRDIGKAAGLSKAEIATLASIVRRGLTDATNVANSLAPNIGKAITQGIENGLNAGSPGVYTTITSIINNAVNKANLAADTHSPSKKMIKLGLDMMEGLYIGISDGAQKVIDAAEKSTQKLIDGFQKDLDKVKGLASDFADTIKGGFSGFLDIAGAFGSREEGTPLSAVIAEQLGGAQQLAFVLKELKSRGAGKALLEQAAGNLEFGQALLQGGPQQIADANAALQEIAALAKETGKGLSEAFFGAKIDKVGDKLDKLHDDLKELNELERFGHSHAIILDGQKVGEAVRSQLIKTGKRNDGTGINP